ncbi:MAG: hypothetical protein HDR03_07185 [Lachnospiraceae bacterium]|nr:hypothetical protein [Lachnospiraceae bacterium]
MINRINRISIKSMTACAAILFLMSILPLLLLGRYNVMCIDDYDYGRLVHDTWIATGSLYQCVLTAFEQVKIVFMNIQGAYTSCFLMSMCPMNFRYDSAFVVPIIMIGMFSVSSFLLGRQILTRWLGSDKYRASFVMFIMLFMFYQVIEAPFEGIYWYNGSVHYIFMESLLFIILTLVSCAIWGEKKAQASIYCAVAAIIAPINAGCNLVTALQAEVLLLLLLIYVFFARRAKLIYALIPYLTYTAGFLCNVLAPGHRVRAQVDTAVGYSPIPAILLSFYYSIVFMVQWTYVFVILVWLALLPVLWRIAKASDKDFKHPILVTGGVYCIISAMFTPTLYGLGTIGLSRVDNIIQMVYYLSLIMLTVYWLGWISHRNSEKSGKDKAVSVGELLGSFLESTQNMMTVSCLLLVMIVWVFTADKNTYTSISALRSLVIGDGKAYYTEAMQRHELYVDDTVRDVVVEPYSMKPALFDFDDLSEDQWYWLNTAVTMYYNKHSVRLMEQD